MFRLITWNVNGIRAVERKKEIQKLISTYQPDILFIQETKAHKDQLSNYLVNHSEYLQEYHSAEKKGYSGVSIWILKKYLQATKHEFIMGMPNWEDSEGRVLRLDIAHYSFLGIYFPNGGKSEQAWKDKIRFYDTFLEYINQLKNKGREVIFSGDLNVAHTEIDLARPKENQGKIGFRVEEREWVDKLIKNEWIDIFRFRYPEKQSYTWWDMPTRARERNVGWRIDYFFTHNSFTNNIQDTYHLNEQMGSDHCPVVLDLKPEIIQL